MRNRDDLLAAIRPEVDAGPLCEGPVGSTLSFDGRQHFLTAAGGAWEVRFEIEQMGAGEVVGVGSLWTASRPGAALSSTEVIVSGRVDERGCATLALAPVAAAACRPVTLVVRMVGRGDAQDPIVSEVVEARGLPG